MANGLSSFPSTSGVLSMADEELFSRSPFSLTASPETAACWAGRPQVLLSLKRLQKSYEHRSDSSLDMLWANLGAGKSHALYHLSHLLKHGSKPASVVPLFVELPEQLKRFSDLYRRIVSEIPKEVLASQISASTSPIPEDLRRAANALANGGPTEKRLAIDWLEANKPHMADLRRATGIGTRIEDDVHAADVLCGIASAMAGSGCRLVLLLDEFQRIGVLQPRARETVLSSMRSVFSRTPQFFSVVLAVGSRLEQNAIALLPGELRTLMGMRPSVSLPEMNPDEALEFVLGRFKFFRPAGYVGSETAPFSKPALLDAVAFIGEQKEAKLIPRTLMNSLAWVYDTAEPGPCGMIQSDATINSLKQLHWEGVSDV